MKPSKYRNKKTEVDGVTFASKKEATRYLILKERLKAGEIASLELQPKYPMVVGGVKVCVYVADFRYREGGESVTEDVKGCKTAVYRIKKKLLKALHGIDVREV